MPTTKFTASRLGLAITGVALFGLFAVAQWNDADGMLWAALYSYVAILSLLLALRVNLKLVALGSLAAYLFAAVRLAPWEAPITEWMPIEAGREAMGLAMAAVWFGILEIYERRTRPAGSNQPA